jgi:hypothetical protein
MDHAIEIAAAFRHESRPGIFELWKVVVVVEAPRASEAERSAFSIARHMLDAEANWRAMGYSQGPVLYAVLSVNIAGSAGLPNEPPLAVRDCLILQGMGVVSELDLDRLTAFEDVPTSFHALHVERCV